MAENINVCLAFDDNYAKYAGVVIASVLANAAETDCLHFYLLDGGVSTENREKILQFKNFKNCEIDFITIDESLFEEYKKVKTHAYITLATYYRLKITSLLPDVDRIIYMDCDVVVNTSLKELFESDLGESSFAGVNDLNLRMVRKNPGYVNAGMLVMDLKNIRKYGIEEKFLEYTKENVDKISCGDQEIINEVCKGNIVLLDPRWNVQSSNFVNRSSYTKNPWIIHFVARKKPWHVGSLSVHRNLYFKYLQLTPWALSAEELKKFALDSKLKFFWEYVKYRPFFWLRPRFYKALYKTFFSDLLKNFTGVKLISDDNTFVVWEPCCKSHSEVVPGFAKYLLDLGYSVSVIVAPEHYESGLFSRFKSKKLFFNKLSRRSVKRYFKHADLSKFKGIMVTTAGKLCDKIHFDQVYDHFNSTLDKHKLFIVEHDAKPAVDSGTWDPEIITLRKLNYKNAVSCAVNPHYFGNVKITPKSEKITNFIMIGKLGSGQSDNNVIIAAALKLLNSGITGFKITVVGKCHLDNLPEKVASHVDVKGRLPFDQMFVELEKADFFLTSYNFERHSFYCTTGASGNFQLMYGFGKPCIIVRDFAEVNGFTEKNSIIYDTPEEYAEAMRKAIEMPSGEYLTMQKDLCAYAAEIYGESLENFRKLIVERTGIVVNE